MKPVIPPTQDLPSNVRAARFSAPEEMKDEVGDIVGLLHLGPEGDPMALEFMFQLSKDEIRVLRHEPYVTITIMADHLHPFALQTSFPPSDKYDTLLEHNHICTTNIVHEKQKFWRCDNPTHDSDKGARIRTCDECWQHTIESTENQAYENEPKHEPDEETLAKLSALPSLVKDQETTPESDD